MRCSCLPYCSAFCLGRFGIVGVNVARCYWEPEATGPAGGKGSWVLSSRELEYYIDPTSGAPISSWKNPWTNATVAVVHVANSPVQFELGNFSLPAPTITGNVNFAQTLNLFYPNPLASDPAKFKPYSWQPMYESSEMFSYFIPRTQVLDTASTSAPGMHFTWTRVSQWLPWMAMDGLEGRLVFTAAGAKAASFEALPAWLQQDITGRLPLYRHAPACYLNLTSGTSWTYFADHFDAYQRGDQFPVAAPAQPKEPCLFPALADQQRTATP